MCLGSHLHSGNREVPPMLVTTYTIPGITKPNPYNKATVPKLGLVTIGRWRAPVITN